LGKEVLQSVQKIFIKKLAVDYFTDVISVSVNLKMEQLFKLNKQNVLKTKLIPVHIGQNVLETKFRENGLKIKLYRNIAKN
jgi:hypothetical protein